LNPISLFSSLACIAIGAAALKMANDREKFVIPRAGKPLGVKGPGLFGIVAAIGNILAVIDWFVRDARMAGLDIPNYREANDRSTADWGISVKSTEIRPEKAERTDPAIGRAAAAGMTGGGAGRFRSDGRRRGQRGLDGDNQIEFEIGLLQHGRLRLEYPDRLGVAGDVNMRNRTGARDRVDGADAAAVLKMRVDDHQIRPGSTRGGDGPAFAAFGGANLMTERLDQLAEQAGDHCVVFHDHHAELFHGLNPNCGRRPPVRRRSVARGRFLLVSFNIGEGVMATQARNLLNVPALSKGPQAHAALEQMSATWRPLSDNVASSSWRGRVSEQDFACESPNRVR
jgi:hypothetical protein